MTHPNFPRLNSVPLRRPVNLTREVEEDFSKARSRSRSTQRQGQSMLRSVSRHYGDQPISASGGGPRSLSVASGTKQMRFHQLMTSQQGGRGTEHYDGGGDMSPAPSMMDGGCVGEHHYSQGGYAGGGSPSTSQRRGRTGHHNNSGTAMSPHRSTARSRAASTMSYAVPASQSIATLQHISDALQQPTTAEDRNLKKKVDDVGRVPHSSLLVGERPFKAGRPGYSALVSGFLGENPTWRTFHRTPARVDYQGRPINSAEDVSVQTKERAMQVARTQKKLQIQRSGTEDTDPALLDKLFSPNRKDSKGNDSGQPAPLLKYSVTYDYAGKRIVMDAAHCPVPPTVHVMKENYFRPTPWDFGSPVQ